MNQNVSPVFAEVLAHIEARGAQGAKITVRELCAAKGLSPDTATVMLRAWVRAGVLRSDGTCRENGLRFIVVPEDQRGSNPRRTAESHMWQAMRGLQTFTADDVMAHANTDGVTVTFKKASSYCQLLQQTGYLKVLRKATKTRRASYRLVRNTGPKAPVERRIRAVVDPNTQASHPVQGGKA